MRLKEDEILKIKETICYFDKNAKIILFGSRVDDTKSGGDIDLMIITDKIDLDKLLKIRVKLMDELGEQKIDLLLFNETDETFRNHILTTGKEL